MRCSRYKRLWDTAIALGVHFVSITSYNEWGEGTQVGAGERERVCTIHTSRAARFEEGHAVASCADSVYSATMPGRPERTLSGAAVPA